MYEIASSLADFIANKNRDTLTDVSIIGDQPEGVLCHLHTLLCSCRGGNSKLVDMLCEKIAKSQILNQAPMTMTSPIPHIEETRDSPAAESNSQTSYGSVPLASDPSPQNHHSPPASSHQVQHTPDPCFLPRLRTHSSPSDFFPRAAFETDMLPWSPTTSTPSYPAFSNYPLSDFSGLHVSEQAFYFLPNHHTPAAMDTLMPDYGPSVDGLSLYLSGTGG